MNGYRTVCSLRALGATIFAKKITPLSSVRVIFGQCRMSSSASKVDLCGIFPPIPTPFDKDENVSYKHLEENLQKWNQVPFKGYVVQGSNGEYTYLSEEERVEVVKKVREYTPKDKLIIAGSGCESTRATISLTKKMADVGADAVLVVTPCYYKGQMKNQALEEHFRKLADSSPVPVILYSCPSCTAIDLPIEVAVNLSSHPNIIGMKDSGGNVPKIGNIAYKTNDQDFVMMAGSASFLFPSYAVGAVGGVCALANVLGNEVCQLHDLFCQGKMEEAKILQQRLISPNAAVTAKYGVPGLKQAMEWFGYYGGPTRLPLIPLSEGETTQMRKDFNNNGFQC
ncbi:4-hydroxy-2-oxoglutarate aldolase, mitochondrial-like [Glandiceps talaboti]